MKNKEQQDENQWDKTGKSMEEQMKELKGAKNLINKDEEEDPDITEAEGGSDGGGATEGDGGV